MTYDKQYKGTTTVGLVCNEGVVLGSESRATMGNLIANKDAQKIYQISDRVGLTTAGSVGDAQHLARLLGVETKLFKLRQHAPMSIKAISTLLSNILNNNRYYPYFVQLLVGGVDATGSAIYSVDAVGGLIEEKKAVATGSGSPFAYGVLEDRYKENMGIDEGAELVIRAISSAIKRDAVSGNGIRIVKITKEGFTRIDDKEIDKITNKLSN